MHLRHIVMLSIFAIAPSVAFASPSCTTEPKSKWMSEDSMKAMIKDLGYKVKTFEVTGNCYEIYGKNKDDKRAEVYFNPVTGAIVKAEIDG